MKENNKEEKRQEEFWFTLFRRGDSRKLWRPQIEILFILRGTGKIYFESTKTGYIVQEKDIFVINSFEIHNLELEEDAVALSLSISLRLAAELDSELLNYHINCRSFLYGEDKQGLFDVLRSDFAKVFREQYKHVDQPASYFRSRAVTVLEDLCRYFLDRERPLTSSKGLETLKPAVDFIQLHYRENITLDDLAEQTFLSKTYISRSFTKYFGIPFTEYVTLLRVAYAAKLLPGKKTVSEIALESGFPSVNSMILAFKRYRKSTPGEYRKQAQRRENSDREEAALIGNEEREVFASLLNNIENEELEHPIEHIKEVKVDIGGKKAKVAPHWNRIMNGGYARSLADGTIQEEIRYIKEKVGFEYIRIKGILDDDMCLLRTDMDGKNIVNYAYVNEILDFILSVGAKPMVELGYVPALLTKNARKTSMRGGIFGVPSDMEKWQELISDLLKHLVSRYGADRVRQWLFAPWPTPDYVELGLCSLEEYEEMYLASYSAVKNINCNFLITGPGTTNPQRYLKAFLQMCRRRNCFPEVITFRSFATVGEKEENGLNLIGNNESFPMAVSADENLLQNTVQKIRNILQEEKLEGVPLVLEEWSNNVWQRDLCNDTCYKSAYLFKNILENNQNLNGIGYFTLNDRIDEVPPSSDVFHGGFGLFTRNDIPKSACRAMELLGQMGEKLLGKGDGYFITRSEDEIQVFLYNYSHYDLLYRYRHMVNMSMTERYNVFVSKEAQAFYIRFENMPDGKYQLRTYRITQEGGSSYDMWVKMGAPESLNQEEEEMLRSLSKPLYRRETVEAGGSILEIKTSLNLQDVCLIKIKAL